MSRISASHVPESHADDGDLVTRILTRVFTLAAGVAAATGCKDTTSPADDCTRLPLAPESDFASNFLRCLKDSLALSKRLKWM